MHPPFKRHTHTHSHSIILTAQPDHTGLYAIDGLRSADSGCRIAFEAWLHENTRPDEYPESKPSGFCCAAVISSLCWLSSAKCVSWQQPISNGYVHQQVSCRWLCCWSKTPTTHRCILPHHASFPKAYAECSTGQYTHAPLMLPVTGTDCACPSSAI